MFFLFFPLPFSVNSAPSALASVKNKISLTMRSPPSLASRPLPHHLSPPTFLITVVRDCFLLSRGPLPCLSPALWLWMGSTANTWASTQPFGREGCACRSTCAVELAFPLHVWVPAQDLVYAWCTWVALVCAQVCPHMGRGVKQATCRGLYLQDGVCMCESGTVEVCRSNLGVCIDPSEGAALEHDTATLNKRG